MVRFQKLEPVQQSSKLLTPWTTASTVAFVRHVLVTVPHVCADNNALLIAVKQSNAIFNRFGLWRFSLLFKLNDVLLVD